MKDFRKKDYKANKKDPYSIPQVPFVLVV